MRICQAYQENFSRNFVFILCVALLLHSCYNMENRYFLACKICCAAESRYFPQIGGRRTEADECFGDRAQEFSQADTIVIAAPYWDLSFPSLLKIYFEAVTVCGMTFRYENEAPKGLCRAERLFYITTAGGPTISDFGFSYVRELAENFYGIRQTKCFRAEGLDIIGADEEGILKRARDEIKEWFSENPDTAEL